MALTIQVTVTCKKHPQYMGKLRPKVECSDCHAIYTARHDQQAFLGEIFGETVRVRMVTLDERYKT